MNSKLKNAEERLEKALSRIDAVAAQASETGSTGSRFIALEAENAELRERHGEIAGRLDQAIARLQKILAIR
jgi:ABC-type phosphate transport system auxiliary subunit